MKKVDYLGMTTTVSEVMQIFDLTKSPVTYAIKMNRVRNRKAGGTWIISMEDAMERWSDRIIDENTRIEIELQFQNYKALLELT